MYHAPTDSLYHFVKGVFYSYANEHTINGSASIFHLHHTHQHLPNQVDAETVETTDDGMMNHSTEDTYDIWRDVIIGSIIY